MPHTTANDGTGPYREFDGQTYGEAHGLDDLEGDFRRDSGGHVRALQGPAMVAEQLVRTLRTPASPNPDERMAHGSDPIRPSYGLDHDRFLGAYQLEAKEAIIDAIGPDADPRVDRLTPEDIEIDRETEGDRQVSIHIEAVLADGTPVEFTATLGALLYS